MIKVDRSNVKIFTDKVMTDAKEITLHHFKNGRYKAKSGYKFTDASSQESRACAANKLINAAKLPEKCGEVFAIII